MNKMNVLVILLTLYSSILVNVVESQLSQAQPCLICGDSALRIWSLMSRAGDRYLRITDRNDDGGSNHKIVDCAGQVNTDNLTSLLQIRERSTFAETRVQFVFSKDNAHYHLYTPSTSGQLLAMPSSEGERQTDNRNTWAPERLLYEHRLFTVFQSVKFRGYYLSCDGTGKAGLIQIINKAYREPNQLFLTIDPGNAIRGVAFGSVNSAGRKKRELSSLDFNPGETRYPHAQNNKHNSWRRARRHSRRKSRHRRPYYRPKFYPTRRPTQAPTKESSISTKFDLPLNITFVLCFWIKTRTRFAQLISVVENLPEYRMIGRKGPIWRRWSHKWNPYQKKTKERKRNIINVSIHRKMLRLELGTNRVERLLSNCDVSDDKFHQVCISLNQQYLLEVYLDSKLILTNRLPELAEQFENRDNLRKRTGTLMLGRTRKEEGEKFDGMLFQVNLWQQYPAFRIRRIATNCACGGGTLVRWEQLLGGTMSNVAFDNNSQCPKLEGYNYDELTQNRLI